MSDLYLFGTAGEGHAVADDQFRAIVTAFLEVHGLTRPMVGVIGTSLATSLERVRFAHGLGVRDFQFSLPPWSVLTETETAAVFAAFCDAFPRAGSCTTTCSARAGSCSRASTPCWRSATRTSSRSGTAPAEPAMVAGLLSEAPQLRPFFTENGYYLGARRWASAVSSPPRHPATRPGRASTTTPARAGTTRALAALYTELSGLGDALKDAVGPGRIDGTYDKVIHKLVNPDFPLRMLPPYEGASDAEFRAYREAVETRFPEWLPA